MHIVSWIVPAMAVGLGQLALATKPGPTDPQQIHLAYAGETGMMVSWNTFEMLAPPKVYYGESPNSLNKIATSDVSVTYNTSTTYNNHVKITGLKPDTMYYYKPTNGATVHSFRTSKPAGHHAPFTVAAFVDMGVMGKLGESATSPDPLLKGQNSTIQSLEHFMDQFDFMLHPGDIAYADYWLKEEIAKYLPNTTIHNGAKVYEKILNKFYNEMERLTKSKPYMVGPGNHEANCDNGGTTNPNTNVSYTWRICLEGQRNFTGYRNHFRMPSEESGGTENFWYSFDYASTHFVVYNTETDLGHGLKSPDAPGGTGGEHAGPFNATKNAQPKFLEADLASVDRTKTPWIVVAGHRPWYVSVPKGSGDICRTCKDAFEEVFYKYGVDMVLSGHVHVYERNAPIYQGVADPNELNNPRAPWYITNGAAGHYSGLDTLPHHLQNYSRYAEDTTYGWSRLIFHNCTHMTQEFVRSADGVVLDSATLYKNHTC